MGNKLMMKLFIASEAFFFLSLIVAYVYFWQAANFREEALTHLNIKTSGVFTALLIASSLTFFLAERYHRRQKIATSKLWLFATLLLGIVFLLGQAHEYYHLITHDITLSKDEFGTSFFTLTGFHGLHVLLGLIMIGIITGLVFQGHLKNDESKVLATAGIYWHFVDGVWLVVFTLVYVLPHLIHL